MIVTHAITGSVSAEGLLTRGGKGTYPLVSGGNEVVEITAVATGCDDLIVTITWYYESSGDEPMLHFIFESCDRSK